MLSLKCYHSEKCLCFPILSFKLNEFWMMERQKLKKIIGQRKMVMLNLPVVLEL